METHFTARRFKAREETKSHAIAAVARLEKYYDGIVRADIVLSYERGTHSVKTAEINIHVHGGVLTGKEKATEYDKAVDAAVGKLGTRLAKYKSKLHQKDKKKVRALQDKV